MPKAILTRSIRPRSGFYSCVAAQLWRFTAACAVFAMAAACGGPAGQSGGSERSAGARQQIIFNLGAEPETLDPSLSTGIPEHRVQTALLCGLTWLDENAKAQPGLAQSWEANEDSTLYTFHLREAKWTNGDPVRASDFVWTWRRILDPQLGAKYAYHLYYLDGAEEINTGQTDDFETLGARALDDRTLEVRMDGPTPIFPELAAHSTYFALHPPTVEGNDQWFLKPETFIGNGPFKMIEWRHNERIVVDRNPDYWDAENTKLNRLVFRMIEQESTEFAAFEAGEIDVTNDVPDANIPRLRDRPDFHQRLLIGTYYVAFNLSHPPFDNPLVRKAFSLAIDRKTIVEKITLAGEEPAMAWVPPGIPNLATGEVFRSERPAYFEDNDLETARAALAEAGYPNGEGFPKARYIYNTKEAHKIIAEALQQMWAKNLGVQITLENMEWAVYLARRKEGAFDIARAGWILDFMDPLNFLDVFLSNSGNNHSRWKSEEFDSLVRQSKESADLNERYALMHQAEELFVNEHVIAPIYFYTQVYLEKSNIKGVIRHPLGGVDFRFASVEEPGA